MSNGLKAKDANLSGETSYLSQANQIMEDVDSITESAVERVVTQGRELTIENLIQATNTITTDEPVSSENEKIEVTQRSTLAASGDDFLNGLFSQDRVVYEILQGERL